MRTTNGTNNWFSVIKSKVEDWYHSLNLNFNTLLTLTAYCIGGFIIGFLGKRYCKFLCLFIVFSALLLWILQYVGVISIDFMKLKSLLGILPADTIDTTMHTWFDWIKAHFLISLSIAIGVFIGFILG